MLAEKLKNLRLEKGLKQEDVAKNIGVSISMVSNYERGLKSPSRSTLKNIAKFFNVSLDYLSSNNELNDMYSYVNGVYEQIKSFIKEYEYEIFKKSKNNEDVTDLKRFLEILKILDLRATYEAYSNADKEDDYKECLEHSVQIINYFNNFCETITYTINHEELDIDKLYDTSITASEDLAKPILEKLNKNIAILSGSTEDEPMPNVNLYIDISKRSNISMPIAAHNDNLDADQQEKMKRDIKNINNKKNNL